MNVCQECNCIAPFLYTMDNGERLCEYCSTERTKPKPKTKRKERVYNDTKWAIRNRFGSIKKFAEYLGYSIHQVNYVINGKGGGNNEVARAIMLEGFWEEMYYDGIITKEDVWIK